MSAWSKEPPSEPGCYWYRERSSPEIWLCEIVDSSIRGRIQYFMRGGYSRAGHISGEWQRVEPPKE